jgi:hypothetical protein
MVLVEHPLSPAVPRIDKLVIAAHQALLLVVLTLAGWAKAPEQWRGRKGSGQPADPRIESAGKQQAGQSHR